MSWAVQQLFDPINGKHFSNRDEAEQAITDRFAALRSEFGPDYSLYQLLKWSYQHGWIKEVEGEYVISVETTQQVATA